MGETSAIVLCLPESVAFFDPDPAETARRGIRLVSQWDEGVIGVAGWSDGGWDAIALAAEHTELPRLVIVATPMSDGVVPPVDLSSVKAKTLLLYGSADPQTGHRHGAQWQKRLPNARLEMVPGGGHDLLPEKWGRVLSHLAPRRRAGAG